MITCTFDLNGAPRRSLNMLGVRYPASSGANADAAPGGMYGLLDAGAIPAGTYHIIDGASAGVAAPQVDKLLGKDAWFALYPAGGVIDDTRFGEQVARGRLLIGTKGAGGFGAGSIALDDAAAFAQLRAVLRGATRYPIPGTRHTACGTVVVA